MTEDDESTIRSVVWNILFVILFGEGGAGGGFKQGRADAVIGDEWRLL